MTDNQCIPHGTVSSLPNPKAAAQVNIDFSPDTEMRLEATVSWKPLKIQARVWHPRLAWMEMLIDNKLERGEAQAFESNVHEYLVFTDSLLRQAVWGNVVTPLVRMQKRLTHVTTAIIVASTIIYAWQPWLGLAIDACGIIVMLAWCWLLEKRKAALLRLLDRHERSRPARRRQYCLTRLANDAATGGCHAE